MESYESQNPLSWSETSGDISLVSGEVQIVAHFRVKEEGVANPTVKRAVKAAEITQKLLWAGMKRDPHCVHVGKEGDASGHAKLTSFYFKERALTHKMLDRFSMVLRITHSAVPTITR